MPKSRIEKVTSAIVRAAEGAAEDHELNYQELVRAMTFALVSLNQKQLDYVQSRERDEAEHHQH